MKFIDTTFGIKPPALALLHFLSDWSPPAFEQRKSLPIVDTFPLYNGREKGVCVIVTKNLIEFGNSLFIFFAEHRNSDQLFVQTWIGSRPFHQPTLADITEPSYYERKFFGYGDMVGPAGCIKNLVNEYMGPRSK